MNLDDLTPGTLVDAHGDTWLYAGQDDGTAILLRDLRADLSCGYTGNPRITRQITATATGRTYPVSLVAARHIGS